ncbi:TrbG/VirB9 family P-type conjugative transfer protein [Enterobacter sp. CM29]|uniref:TrbG/VirB9 family P-type conjugative transfer protein n=1 Tax=Enterobacter sp. CM29 TaxID=2738449 RepID=UPI0015C58005|nr:TrbG/VirB9 family P-type conjugative transfer protein [Enterobacter sp. CM29]NQD64126.1 TrbG/VirB9 family P-type conjugative transfer protein [Enterobacter sp. CM29]
MKLKKTLTLSSVALVATLAYSASSLAEQCKLVNWKENMVLRVNSALYLGTRVQLPEGTQIVTAEPRNSNLLWDVAGAANQILIRPTSDEPGGEKTMATVFLSNGKALDIEGTRVPSSRNQPCVVIRGSNGDILSRADRTAINAYSSAGRANASDMRNQLNEMRMSADTDKRQAVYDALRKYRYHIYTRYNWSTGKGFAGKNIVADVYDDGRFTYIRLSQPNRGLMAVQAEVGGKKAIVPTKYDDAYAIYSMTGIYPKFTLTLDGVELEIERADNATNGES